MQNIYLQYLFQVNKYCKPPEMGFLSSEVVPSVLFFQVESLITILSLSLIITPKFLGHKYHGHHSPPPGNVECLSQIYSQSKDFRTTSLSLLPLTREATVSFPGSSSAPLSADSQDCSFTPPHSGLSLEMWPVILCVSSLQTTQTSSHWPSNPTI